MRSPEVDRTILTPHHNPQQQMVFFGFRLVESLRMAFYRIDNSVKATTTAFRGGGFEPPTFGSIIPLLLATLVGQPTDSQVPDQFELLAPIGPPIPVVCEHSHVQGTIANLKER
jgi:hypothetical protein